jgi:hypothetical protein
MTYIQVFSSFAPYPLSRFPQGGKASCDAPSTLGEGRGGGKNTQGYPIFIIFDTH